MKKILTFIFYNKLVYMAMYIIFVMIPLGLSVPLLLVYLLTCISRKANIKKTLEQIGSITIVLPVIYLSFYAFTQFLRDSTRCFLPSGTQLTCACIFSMIYFGIAENIGVDTETNKESGRLRYIALFIIIILILSQLCLK